MGVNIIVIHRRWILWSTLAVPSRHTLLLSALTGTFISSYRYNLECALSQVQPLEPWGNIVYGYAT